jgi:hypothetical protein
MKFIDALYPPPGLVPMKKTLIIKYAINLIVKGWSEDAYSR